MSLRSPDNPKELRTALHTFYEEYAHGTVNFPRIRLVGDPESVEGLPRKTQPIARALIHAWDEIDTERGAHRGLVDFQLKNPNEQLLSGTGGMILGRAGRNALDVSILTPVNGDIKVAHTLVGPRPVKELFLENACIELGDDGRVNAGIPDKNMSPQLEALLNIGGLPLRLTTFTREEAGAA